MTDREDRATRPTLEQLRAKHGPAWGISQKDTARKEAIPWDKQTQAWEQIAISPQLAAMLGQPDLTAEQRKVLKLATPHANAKAA